MMMLGKIFGKVTTKEFKFLATSEIKKFEYVQIYHQVYDFVLAQILEIEKNQDTTTATCELIGYLDKDGKVKSLRIPLEPQSEVFLAQDELIKKMITLKDTTTSAYIGKLDGKDIKVSIDLKNILTKHLAVLAKSGSGKSYTVGVLLEEIMDKKVPLLIIDPHGEYSSLKFANTNEEELERMAYFGVKPKGYPIQEYSDTRVNLTARPLRLPETLTIEELIEILPQKLSNNQLGMLHNAINEANSTNLSEIILALQSQESSLKWTIIGIIEQLQKSNLFSSAPTPYHEMIKSSSASIINLRGIDPEIQDIIVYKLTKDLFELRKQNKIPPFFLVIEEAHNYCPERSFGEKRSSKVLRTIASEGRKFGLGLCIISQRPARVDKSVISQCTTQIIMKITNPNDLKAITSSVEGITSNTEQEIQNLSIGTSLITGITDVPLFVNIRPRKTQHGGHSIEIIQTQKTLNQSIEVESEIIPIIKEATKKEKIKIEKEPNIEINIPESDDNIQENIILEKNEPILEPEEKVIAPPQIISSSKEETDMFEELETFQEQNLLPIIQPTITENDLVLMSEKKIKRMIKKLIPCYLITCKEKDTEFKLLIEQIEGKVITNIDDYQKKALPNLQKLTKKELSILQKAYTSKTFKQLDLIKQLGLNFDIVEELNNLIKIGYIEQIEKDKYKLSEEYIFSSLMNFKTFSKPEFINLNYDIKEEPKLSIDKIISLLERFTNIVDKEEVFTLKYELEFE
jgi:uncharacterized protein